MAGHNCDLLVRHHRSCSDKMLHFASCASPGISDFPIRTENQDHSTELAL